jgi:nucleotide-binding universal stress UspA family protein
MTIESKAAATGEWDTTHKPVVVAVDGSERNRSAVAWAAHEAAALDCEMVLVTVLPDHLVPARGFSVSGPDQAALDMLAEARHGVRDIVDESRVHTEAVSGVPVEALLEKAGTAALVVVGKRGLGGFTRVIVGSTSIALAGRSPVPVAIVPDEWDQADREGRPVVLGVDLDKVDEEPIDAAIGRAERLGVPLVAVHGWETPAAYSWDAATVAGVVAEAEQAEQERFDELLASWRERHPGVVIRPMRVHKHPAAAILEAAEDAQLVVLGRHPAGVFGGFAFGSVARAVLHYAESPVVVVPSGEPRGRHHK